MKKETHFGELGASCFFNFVVDVK